MKFKLVPEPREVEFLRDVQRSLPLVPADENDWCARVLDRTDLRARDAAREWLTFLRALGLAEETSSGFHRVRDEPDSTALGRAFRERVFGAEDVLDILTEAESPLEPESVFERFREDIPNWERYRHTDWETEWRERVRRLLGWCVELGLAERVDGNYRVA